MINSITVDGVIQENLKLIYEVKKFNEVLQFITTEYNNVKPLDSYGFPNNNRFSTPDINSKGFDHVSIYAKYGHLTDKDPCIVSLSRRFKYGEHRYVKVYGVPDFFHIGDYENYRIETFSDWRDRAKKLGYTDKTIAQIEDVLLEEEEDMADF